MVSVDDPSGLIESGSLENEHPAWADLFGLGNFTIGFVVVLERTAELEGDTTPHYTHTVDGVDEGFRVELQDIAVG